MQKNTDKEKRIETDRSNQKKNDPCVSVKNTRRSVYKVSDIAGCEVCTVSGKKLGILRDVLPTKANDVWVVESPLAVDGELLIPALAEVVHKVDIVQRKIVVDLPQGLEDVYASFR